MIAITQTAIINNVNIIFSMYNVVSRTKRMTLEVISTYLYIMAVLPQNQISLLTKLYTDELQKQNQAYKLCPCMHVLTDTAQFGIHSTTCI